MHAYNPRAYMPATRRVEAEESQLRGQPGLHSKCQSSLGYRMWPYLPKERKKLTLEYKVSNRVKKLGHIIYRLLLVWKSKHNIIPMIYSLLWLLKGFFIFCFGILLDNKVCVYSFFPSFTIAGIFKNSPSVPRPLSYTLWVLR